MQQEKNHAATTAAATAATQAYDVAIIGGGPAGSTAAALLAKKGRRVVLFEREKFPRFHIGESLLPYSMDIFDRLGVREKLDKIALPKIGGEVATTCGTHSAKFYFKFGFRLKHHRAYQVLRSDFDKILLDNAKASGAEVREETAVENLALDENGATLSIRSKANSDNASDKTNAANAAENETIRASYLLDCSGRNAIVGTHFKLKQSYPHLQKFSVFAHFENVARDSEDGGFFTHLIRAQDHWFWIIGVTPTRTSIGVVMDTNTFKNLKKSPEQVFEHFLQQSEEMQRRMRNATRVTQVYSIGDYSYRNSQFAGDRWLLAGDAAGFLDPIWSTGVFLAMLSGENAADAVDQALREPSARPALFRRYDRKLNRVMDLYLRLVSSWYRHEFVEVFMNPTERFQLAPAVNAALAGNIGGGFSIWWRMQLFYLVLFAQRFIALVPRLAPMPKPQTP